MALGCVMERVCTPKAERRKREVAKERMPRGAGWAVLSRSDGGVRGAEEDWYCGGIAGVLAFSGSYSWWVELSPAAVEDGVEVEARQVEDIVLGGLTVRM